MRRLLLALALLVGLGAAQAQPFRWIDTHVHFDAHVTPTEAAEAAEEALRTMDENGIAMSVFEPPPAFAGRTVMRDYPAFVDAVRAHPGRLAFLGGGGILNGILQNAVARGQSTDHDRDDLITQAMAIAAAGAVGFGEIACEHLTLSNAHAYESVPPDHPLMLALSDVAASRQMVVDIHMEAVLRDSGLPPRYTSPPNAPTLRANIEPLQRLLAHNRGTRIVWAHAGWDNTGQRTVELCRTLLEGNDNLYMSLKLNNNSNYGMLAAGRPSEEWLRLLRDHPDRFVLGSDVVYGANGVSGGKQRHLLKLLSLLPPEAARMIGYENAIRIYRLRPPVSAEPIPLLAAP